VANVVVVPKKNGGIRVYMDYRDLNKASSNDDFHLPYIDVLVDNSTKKKCHVLIHGWVFKIQSN
jgi:hypothetical protein